MHTGVAVRRGSLASLRDCRNAFGVRREGSARSPKLIPLRQSCVFTPRFPPHMDLLLAAMLSAARRLARRTVLGGCMPPAAFTRLRMSCSPEPKSFPFPRYFVTRLVAGSCFLLAKAPARQSRRFDRPAGSLGEAREVASLDRSHIRSFWLSAQIALTGRPSGTRVSGQQSHELCAELDRRSSFATRGSQHPPGRLFALQHA